MMMSWKASENWDHHSFLINIWYLVIWKAIETRWNIVTCPKIEISWNVLPFFWGDLLTSQALEKDHKQIRRKIFKTTVWRSLIKPPPWHLVFKWPLLQEASFINFWEAVNWHNLMIFAAFHSHARGWASRTRRTEAENPSLDSQEAWVGSLHPGGCIHPRLHPQHSVGGLLLREIRGFSPIPEDSQWRKQHVGLYPQASSSNLTNVAIRKFTNYICSSHIYFHICVNHH